MPRRRVRCEQAVYGSFPFWQRGYGVLARSPGCRAEWLVALKTACQRCGEPPVGAAEAHGFFTLRLDRGPWMIVGASPQGHDDQGRPGARAFHALFVTRWTYLRSGADPFAFAHALRREWYPEDMDASLPQACGIDRPTGLLRTASPDTALGDDRLVPIVTALTGRRRVVVQSAGPIDALANAVWKALPWRVRVRASVATWAFDNANRFDLVALPRLAGAARAGSDLIIASEDPGR